MTQQELQDTAVKLADEIRSWPETVATKLTPSNGHIYFRLENGQEFNITIQKVNASATPTIPPQA